MKIEELAPFLPEWQELCVNKRFKLPAVVHCDLMCYLPKKIPRRALIDFCTADNGISSGSSDLAHRKIDVFNPENIDIPFLRLGVVFHAGFPKVRELAAAASIGRPRIWRIPLVT
jgi:hypothetical protein